MADFSADVQQLLDQYDGKKPQTEFSPDVQKLLQQYDTGPSTATVASSTPSQGSEPNLANIQSQVGGAGVTPPVQTSGPATLQALANAPNTISTYLAQPSEPGFNRSSVLPLAVNPDIKGSGGIMFDPRGPVNALANVFKQNSPGMVAQRGNITPDMALMLMRPALSGTSPLLSDAAIARSQGITDTVAAPLSSDFRANPLAPNALAAPPMATGEVSATGIPPASPKAVQAIAAPTQAQTPATTPAAPNSGGAAATDPALSGMTANQTLANRSQAEGQRLITPLRGPYQSEIPGVTTTLAEQTLTPSVAREQKMIESQLPDLSQEVKDSNQEAWQNHFQGIASSKTQVEAGQAAAKAQYLTGINDAFGNKQPLNPDLVQAAHDEMVENGLNHPQNVDNDTLQQYMGPLVKRLIGPDGNPITDPQRLYGLRQQIGRLQTKASQANDPNLSHIVGELQGFKDVLDPIIETGAPGFQTTIKSYSDALKPLGAQEALQNYETGANGSRSIYDSKGNMTFNGVHGMMKDIVNSRASGDPLSPFQNLSDDDMGKLWKLHDDLEANATQKEMSSARGSDTAQNIMDAMKGAGKSALAASIGGVLSRVPGISMLKAGADAFASQRAQNALQTRGRQMLLPPQNPSSGGP